ncbi:hypothetical protein [Pseudomonas gingeri]|uniref:hypothetical protein n=1 Tax=Pseudomonas gingeri TaxID=117681 RepID=UPI0015A14BDC|nr:hypothetical protein [Pseudomonas gingeri]NWA04802.1 hypothetical protein [Pseudomonas gingeri]NWA17683.1 hypothetical protein [Pseudomonas gingeri]NWA56909.1 hypothetical protein [Pseudomonas gingeri]NWA97225.1 hypothetical protein [Pseudomonas gingeri]NWB01723.1 hypothetical protein [Pseudomonas gingeri]
MAKVEYVVVDGCIQDGKKVYVKGDVYVAPSTEIRDLLLDEGKIVARGKLDPPAARSSGRSQQPGGSQAPGGAQSGSPNGGASGDDDNDDDPGNPGGDD